MWKYAVLIGFQNKSNRLHSFHFDIEVFLLCYDGYALNKFPHKSHYLPFWRQAITKECSIPIGLWALASILPSHSTVSFSFHSITESFVVWRWPFLFSFKVIPFRSVPFYPVHRLPQSDERTNLIRLVKEHLRCLANSSADVWLQLLLYNYSIFARTFKVYKKRLHYYSTSLTGFMSFSVSSIGHSPLVLLLFIYTHGQYYWLIDCSDHRL